MTDTVTEKAPRFLFLKGFPLALTLMTRLPLPISWIDLRAVTSAPAWYPVAGWLIGGLTAVPVYYLSLRALQYPAAAGIMWVIPVFWVAISVWITRGLHFDGWCDCCDALMAVATPERRREIMKDSHVGSGAVLGGSMLIGGKLLIILALCVSVFSGLGSVHPFDFALLLTAPPVMARFFVTCLAYIGRPPVAGGMSGVFVGKLTLGTLITAGIFMSPVLLFLPITLWLELLAIGAAVTVWWWLKARSAFGGVNGDVLGASCETVEVMLFLTLLFA